MKRKSKYIGRIYEGFEVISAFEKCSYRRKYGKESKIHTHAAYSFILQNQNNEYLILSGNQLRLIDDGQRSIKGMFSTKAYSSKNPTINRYLRDRRESSCHI